jgi:hypothetical protein
MFKKFVLFCLTGFLAVHMVACKKETPVVEPPAADRAVEIKNERPSMKILLADGHQI